MAVFQRHDKRTTWSITIQLDWLFVSVVSCQPYWFSVNSPAVGYRWSPTRNIMTNKAWMKIWRRRIARRRGFVKWYRGYGDRIVGVKAEEA